MGNAVSTKHIKDRALYRADMSLGFIDDDQLMHDIGDSVAELHQILIDAFEDYDVHQKEITLSASTASYSLPPDFLRARKVFKKTGTERKEVFKFSLDDLGRDTIIHTASGDVYQYRILGSKIWLNPIPASSGTLELWYSKHPTKPTDDQSQIEFDAPSGWEDYIVWDVAAKMLMREESDATMAINEKEKARARITQSVTQRDDEPDTVRDVYHRFENLDVLGRYGRW